MKHQKNKARLALLLVVVLAVSLFTACGGGQGGAPAAGDGPTVFRLGTVLPEHDSLQVAAEKFAELVYARTNGAYMIEIFPNAVLGDERTMIEGMQIGSIDMGMVTSAPFINFVPEMGIFDMPFLFANYEEAYRILDGAIGRSMLDHLQAINIKGLAYAERGFRNITNNVRPINSAEDVAGLAIRVMENEIYIAAFEAMNVNTIPMSWGDALTALQQGTIDGQENPVIVVWSHSLWEAQQHLTMTRHAYSPSIISMNLSLFNNLAPDVQQIFLDSALEAAIYQRAWQAEHTIAQMADIVENGMVIVHYPDLESFRQAVSVVYERFDYRFGYYVRRIHAELGR